MNWCILLAQIQRRLAAKDAEVSKSVMLKYFAIDAEREVDIFSKGE